MLPKTVSRRWNLDHFATFLKFDLGNCARLADRVFTVDEGYIRPIQYADINGGVDDKDSTPESSSPGAIATEKVVISANVTPKNVELETTQVTDGDVYRTYFGSIGRFNIILYFLGGVVSDFCLKFPGMSPFMLLTPLPPFPIC